MEEQRPSALPPCQLWTCKKCMQVLVRCEQRRNFQCAVVPADVELQCQPAIQVVITRHFPSVAVKRRIPMQEGITAEDFEPWGSLCIRERRQEQNRTEDNTCAHRISSRALQVGPP